MTAGWKRRDALLLALIVTGGAMARFYGLGFGLPHQGVRPDELTLIARVMEFFSWDLNPRFFSYPSLLMYILFAAYNAYRVQRYISCPSLRKDGIHDGQIK